jgi:hypothetical protein
MQELVGIVHDQWGDWEGYARAVDVSHDVIARLRTELLSDPTL